MTQTYFRIQWADRDVNELLDKGYQFSRAWNGGDKYTRPGVSTCASIEDLALYLADGSSGAIRASLDARPYAWVLVELEGEPTDGGAVDGVFEILVRPTRIVAVESVEARLMDAITAADDEMDSYIEDLWDDEGMED